MTVWTKSERRDLLNKEIAAVNLMEDFGVSIMNPPTPAINDEEATGNGEGAEATETKKEEALSTEATAAIELKATETWGNYPIDCARDGASIYFGGLDKHFVEVVEENCKTEIGLKLVKKCYDQAVGDYGLYAVKKCVENLPDPFDATMGLTDEECDSFFSNAKKCQMLNEYNSPFGNYLQKNPHMCTNDFYRDQLPSCCKMPDAQAGMCVRWVADFNETSYEYLQLLDSRDDADWTEKCYNYTTSLPQGSDVTSGLAKKICMDEGYEGLRDKCGKRNLSADQFLICIFLLFFNF